MRNIGVGRNELGFPMTDALPEKWTWRHVNLQLVEAFEALPNLPGDYSTGAGGVKIAHLYDDDDRLAQQDADEQKASRANAASRVILTPQQTTRALAALDWPRLHLAAADPSRPAQFVGRVAKRLARGKDFTVIADELALSERYVRHRYYKGCEQIATRLRTRRVPVF
jgi:hypothetical protein